MLEKNFSGKKSVEWRKTCAVVIGEEVSIETYIKCRSLLLLEIVRSIVIILYFSCYS